MLTEGIHFEAGYPVNGLDAFLLTLDSMMMRSSGTRNVCCLALELDGAVNATALSDHLSAQPLAVWLCSLRLVRRLPFTVPRWRRTASPVRVMVSESSVASSAVVPQAAMGQKLNPWRQAPIEFRLLQTPDGRSVLLCNWHHSLMDARGAERIIKACLDGSADSPPRLPLEAADVLPAPADRWHHCRLIIDFLRAVTKPQFGSLYRRRSSQCTLKHAVLRFTLGETASVDAYAADIGAAATRLSFQLAATARAVETVRKARGETADEVLVPVPQDRRRKGDEALRVGNHVTFFFYRLAVADLESLKTALQSLNRQTLATMRAGHPANYLTMSHMMRHTPRFMYRQFLTRTTHGRMASFFFSDTGSSLDVMDSVSGVAVREAVHYPPNLSPPGITFIFSRFRGRLRVTVSYVEEVVSTAELDGLLQQLRAELMGERGRVDA